MTTKKITAAATVAAGAATVAFAKVMQNFEAGHLFDLLTHRNPIALGAVGVAGAGLVAGAVVGFVRGSTRPHPVGVNPPPARPLHEGTGRSRSDEPGIAQGGAVRLTITDTVIRTRQVELSGGNGAQATSNRMLRRDLARLAAGTAVSVIQKPVKTKGAK